MKLMKHILTFLLSIFVLSTLTYSANVTNDLDAKIDTLTTQIISNMTQNSRTTIAIIEFSEFDGKVTALGKYIAEELTNRLFMTKKFQVVERELLNKVLQEHKLNLTGLVDASSIKELGKILGVSAIVSGTVSDLGDSVKINARLIDTETANILAVAGVEVAKSKAVDLLLSKVITESNRTDSNESIPTPTPPLVIIPTPIPVVIATLTPTPTSAPIIQVTPTEKKLVIAGIVYNQNDSDLKMRILLKGMKDAAKKYNVDFREAYNSHDFNKGTRLIYEFISQKVDAICIPPYNDNSSITALQMANNNGIKVITYLYGYHVDTDFPVYYVAWNQSDLGVQSGKEARNYIQNKLKGKPTVKVAIIAYKAYLAEESNARVNGFLDQIKDLHSVQVVAEQDAWQDEEMNTKTVGDIITKNPDLDIIFAAANTKGSILAVKNAGKTGKIAVFGGGNDLWLADFLLSSDNILQAFTGVQPYLMGYVAAENAVKAIKGETVPKVALIPGFLLSRNDQANVKRVKENPESFLSRNLTSQKSILPESKFWVSQPASSFFNDESSHFFSVKESQAFTGPILNAIEDREPDYQDDFSSKKYKWPTGMKKNKPSDFGESEYSNGEYYMETSSDRFPEYTSLESKSPALPMFSDLAVQFDLRYNEGDSGCWGINVRDNKSGFYTVKPDTEGGLSIRYCHDGKNDDLFFRFMGQDPKGTHLPMNHFLIIFKGSKIAVFVNGELAAFTDDLFFSQKRDKGIVKLQVGANVQKPFQVYWDNLKIWDISKLKL
jgi:sugar transport system substrate-binding protein